MLITHNKTKSGKTIFKAKMKSDAHGNQQMSKPFRVR